MKDRPNVAAFTLWSDDQAASATGTFVFFAGTKRYTIPFTNAVAADRRSTNVRPSIIAVRFDAPTEIDSGYVASLDGAPCPVHAPFADARLFDPGAKSAAPSYRREPGMPDWRSITQTLVDDAVPMPAPVPEVVEAPPCAKPYVRAATIQGVPAQTPINGTSVGTVVVMLALRADGTVADMRVDRGLPDKRYGNAAMVATARSTFRPETYRCRPVSGDFRFIVQFGGY